MDEANIEKAITEGHRLAGKIKEAKVVADIDAMTSELDEYCDFVDDTFGTIGDLGEKTCTLSVMIYMAAEEKARQLEQKTDQIEKGNAEAVAFELMLDSKKWLNRSE